MEFNAQDHFWMQQALALAQYAARQEEVPVGAVLVHNQRLIAEGVNATIRQNDPSAHAEIQALRLAGQRLQNYRLPYTTLYVTLEPCLMCLGALFHARVQRIVYATTDYKTGVCHSVLSLAEHPQLNHHAQVQGGLYAEPARRLLQRFFQQKRQK